MASIATMTMLARLAPRALKGTLFIESNNRFLVTGPIRKARCGIEGNYLTTRYLLQHS